jgi:hypothetical protein
MKTIILAAVAALALGDAVASAQGVPQTIRLRA